MYTRDVLPASRSFGGSYGDEFEISNCYLSVFWSIIDKGIVVVCRKPLDLCLRLAASSVPVKA